MPRFPRPTVVISRCIDFDSCRYNGHILRASLREELAPHVTFRPVCPELEIGLGVPRDPIRMVAGNHEIDLVQPATGLDLTDRMRAFSSRYLGERGDVDGCVLKSRSPSCGIRGVKVYDSAGNVVSSAPGRFAAAVLERFPNAAVEDEGRLNDLRVREHFLTRIFTSASLRATLARGTPAALVRFHSRNKLLLMAYDEVRLRTLGRIVAGAGVEPLDAVGARYEAEVQRALASPPGAAAHVNALLHVLGHVSAGLSRAEKARFLHALADYRNGHLPVSALQEVLRSWSARFDNGYLTDQTYLAPFPPGLVRLERRRRRGREASAAG